MGDAKPLLGLRQKRKVGWTIELREQQAEDSGAHFSHCPFPERTEC